jgi:hypothetical protein
MVRKEMIFRDFLAIKLQERRNQMWLHGRQVLREIQIRTKSDGRDSEFRKAGKSLEEVEWLFGSVRRLSEMFGRRGLS